jgi:hypothetical protein
LKSSIILPCLFLSTLKWNERWCPRPQTLAIAFFPLSSNINEAGHILYLGQVKTPIFPSIVYEQLTQSNSTYTMLSLWLAEFQNSWILRNFCTLRNPCPKHWKKLSEISWK